MPEEESVNLFRLNTIKEGDKMPCFIILLCLCLFPFSTVRCEEQTVVESLDASILTIWGAETGMNPYLQSIARPTFCSRLPETFFSRITFIRKCLPISRRITATR